MDGLDIRHGRLINNRPDGVTGIQQAASARKKRRRMEKIEQISEGIVLSEAKKELFITPFRG